MLLGRPCTRCHLGRCVFFLIVALLVDAVGLILLLLGIFAPLNYWDFFVYTGALILALSLLPWLAWYSFNIEPPPTPPPPQQQQQQTSALSPDAKEFIFSNMQGQGSSTNGKFPAWICLAQKNHTKVCSLCSTPSDSIQEGPRYCDEEAFTPPTRTATDDCEYQGSL